MVIRGLLRAKLCFLLLQPYDSLTGTGTGTSYKTLLMVWWEAVDPL